MLLSGLLRGGGFSFSFGFCFTGKVGRGAIFFCLLCSVPISGWGVCFFLGSEVLSLGASFFKGPELGG